MKVRGILKTAGRGVKRSAGGLWRCRGAALRIVLALAGAAACILPAIFLNTLLGYLPIFFYCLLLLLGGTYLLILRGSIHCSAQDTSLSCPRTQSEEFCLTVTNRSPLVAPMVKARLSMQSDYSGSGRDTEMILALAPFETREFKFSVTFAHLGRYSVGVSGLELGGLLNLARTRLPGGGAQQVHVTPLRHSPAYLALTDLVETEDSRAKASAALDGTDYTGVREYVAGDPIKNIHWKLSAHSNGYMTKQTEVLGNSGVDIILDMAAPKWTGEDGAYMYDAVVESACAVALYAAEKGMDSSMWFFDRSRKERNITLASASSFDQMVDELPGITDNAALYPLDQLLSHASTSLYTKNNIVLCSARADEAIFKRLEQIQAARRHPVLIYVIPPGLDEREREDRAAAVKVLERRNIPCHIISKVQDLK